jgi:alkaline phosphatase D
LEWLKKKLAASKATWKIICSDMPVGLIVPDGTATVRGIQEGLANGNGPPMGRELETAELLSFMKRQNVKNAVWLTADVHYAAAHHYHPDRARFKDFDPFWEFVAGPLHAATYGPGTLDDTFGPEVRFQSRKPGAKQGRPPTEGFQFFGTGKLDGKSETLTVSLWNLAGEKLYAVDLTPR